MRFFSFDFFIFCQHKKNQKKEKIQEKNQKTKSSKGTHLRRLKKMTFFEKEMLQEFLQKLKPTTKTEPKPCTLKVALSPSAVLLYHPGKNNYRCKSLTNSKTISVRKNDRIIFCKTYYFQKHNVRMKLQTLQILQIIIECRNIFGGALVHISKHSLFRLKITVGCRLCIVWFDVVCVV